MEYTDGETVYEDEKGKIYFDMNDGSSLIARPSGTEPLIKVYFSIPAENEEKAIKQFESYKEVLVNML
jgi:phosphomannomutase